MGLHAIGAIDMDEEERRERRRRQRQKVISCCKSVAAFLFSHIGLAAMVVAYSIAGGFLFQALEAPHERRNRIQMTLKKENKVEVIWTLASQLKADKIDGGNFTQKVRGLLVQFQEEVVLAVSVNGWDGSEDTDESSLKWSFAGALLYAVTVITTIGYGHVAPKTVWGRLVTIVYALVGIPLTFLYLSNIGNFLADLFRLFYKKICCDLCCCKKCERRRKRERMRLRRRRALQRNSALHSSVPLDTQFLTENEMGDYMDGEFIDLPQDVVPDPAYLYLEDRNIPPGEDGECGLKGGCPQTVAAQTNQAYTGDPYDSDVKDFDEGFPEVRETAILDDDTDDSPMEVRETDILDDDTGSEGDKRKKSTQSSNGLPAGTGFLDHLDEAKETDILDDDDEDEDDQKVEHDGDEDDVFQSGDNDEDLDEDDNTDDDKDITKLSKKEQRKAKKEKERKLKEEKKKQKQLEKEEKKLQKEKEKEEKKRLKEEKRKQKQEEKDKKKNKGKETDDTQIEEPSSDHHFEGEFGEDAEAIAADMETEDSEAELDPESKCPLEEDETDKTNTKDVDGPDTLVDEDKGKAKEKTGLFSKKRSKDRKKDKELQETGDSDDDNVNIDSGSKDKKLKDKDVLPDETDEKHMLGSELRPTDSTKLKRRENRSNKRDNSRFRKLRGSRKFKNDTKRKQSTSSDDTKKDTSASDNRSLPPSEESFVTAPGDSTSWAGDPSLMGSLELGSDEEASPHDNYHRQGVVKFQPHRGTLPLDVALGDAAFDIELLDYPDLSKDPTLFAEDPFDYEDDEEEEKVTVPVAVCLIIIAGYISAGSMLFTLWEKWDFLTGAYFCFITLSTIGFGDIVPGTDMKEWASHEKLVLCALWLAFGLSLLAMCFNLMQEEVREKVKRIGKKIGLLKNEAEG